MLSSPRRFYRDVAGWNWAADNDAFSAWDEGRYRRMLEGIAELPGGLFVTLPDVVGDGDRTLLLVWDWLPLVRETGKPAAVVAQDGMTVESYPFDLVEAVFVGGTSEFKLGEVAAEIVYEAKQRGLWTHMGRVNSHQRLRYAKALGCDSVDGTSFSWFRDRWLQQFLDHAAAPRQEMLS